ncbi:hypothetical protein [Enterococcus italicus]|uniref:hypothetical protein n=1 Tax=Enterococcus italicus TaxID=246144 RepID=UPI003F47819C
MSQTQNEAIEKSLQKVISKEAANELAWKTGTELIELHRNIYEQMAIQSLLPEEITVKSVLKELYELTEADFSKELLLSDLQDLMFQKVDMLAGLLGIELE